jgi:molybdopterin-guanine dinucleotide biosynthesis protein A
VTGLTLRLEDVTGIVLAGGRSARFGSDKLATEIDGRTLLDRALVAVAAVAGPIVVVTTPDGDPPIPDELLGRVRVIHDPEPFGGPLLGLVAALRSVETSVALVVGGDMPRMVPVVLHRLATATSAERPAAVLEVPERIQPLPMAVWARAALAGGNAVLGRGGRSLRELLRELSAVSIPAPVWLALDPAGAPILDIDRPGDLGS